MNKSLFFILTTLVIFSCSCKKENNNSDNGSVQAGNDPNFTIQANSDVGFTNFRKKVMVFDIPIYAVTAVEDEKLLHAANIMAQYLDNNEDGTIDNSAVHAAMKNNKAFMIMWKKESDLNSISPPNGHTGQDLGADETVPAWHTNGRTGRFDAALEEVWHIITHAGYASAYPTVFGEFAATSMTNAMDIARGGHFTNIPSPYPSNAWYTYDDNTCDYNCMATEYIYWAMTSILGAQVNRLSEIQQEWKLNTKVKVQTTDAAIYSLLTDSQYKFPTVLPDGTYRR